MGIVEEFVLMHFVDSELDVVPEWVELVYTREHGWVVDHNEGRIMLHTHSRNQALVAIYAGAERSIKRLQQGQ